MAGNRYLLDTNTVIRLLGRDGAFQSPLLNDPEILLSATVIGELYFGAMKSSRVDANLARVDRLVSSRVVFPCDSRTAYQYGKIKMELRRKGRPIPDNDIWIAAMAMQHGLTLVTSDEHFLHVDGLDYEQW